MRKCLLDIIAPHYCFNCPETGQILCSSCKNYILKVLKTHQKMESSNIKYFDFIYSYDNQEPVIKKLIYQYKLGSIIDTALILADFLLELIPKGPKYVIIPLPTAQKHIKSRGFDHNLAIAQVLADKTNWPIIAQITNRAQKAQKDLSATERRANVQDAFNFIGKLDPSQHYLLVDDIFTTGASVKACAKELMKAGAKKISLAVLLKP